MVISLLLTKAADTGKHGERAGQLRHCLKTHHSTYTAAFTSACCNTSAEEEEFYRLEFYMLCSSGMLELNSDTRDALNEMVGVWYGTALAC